jgi:hypothetical protein
MKVLILLDGEMMKVLILGMVCVMLVLVGCDDGFECESAPDSYNGAALAYYASSGSMLCAIYDGASCSYTLCQTDCGGWEEGITSCP